MCSHCENSMKILHSNQKCWLTHLTITPIALSSFLTARPHIPRSECVILHFGVSLLTDPHPLSFSFDLTGFCEHSSLCGLRANIDKEMSSEHSGATSKIPKFPSLVTHPRTYEETHISIYIYTHECSLLYYTPPFLNPCHLFTINHITMKRWNIDITINIQCVILSKRSPHHSSNKRTCRGSYTTQLQEDNQQCAGMACSSTPQNQS